MAYFALRAASFWLGVGVFVGAKQHMVLQTVQ